VDQQTKQALKRDKFVDTTTHGLEWAGDHRKTSFAFADRTRVLVVAIGVTIFANHQSDAAAVAFGAAMQTYQAPLVTPGQPNDPGVKTYNSAQERAKAANAQFMAVATSTAGPRTEKMRAISAG